MRHTDRIVKRAMGHDCFADHVQDVFGLFDLAPLSIGQPSQEYQHV